MFWTIIGDKLMEEVKKSNSCMFNSFINMLLTNKKPVNELYDPKKFDLWICSKGISTFKKTNEINKTLGDIVEDNDVHYLGTIAQLDIETVSEEDGLPSSGCYQAYLNIPASAYIFSNFDYPPKCKIKKDTNYIGYDYSVSGLKDFSMKDNEETWSAYSGYFDANYCFLSGYDVSEYEVYNVDRDLLVESKVNVMCQDTDIDIKSSTIGVGGALLLTWYDNDRCEIYNYKNKPVEFSAIDNEKLPVMYPSFPTYSADCIPCVYMELPKNYNFTDYSVNIKWSENGIFTFK